MMPKIDLTLLKRLVAELTTAINDVDTMVEQKQTMLKRLLLWRKLLVMLVV
jgi:hypothetical protein